MNFHDRSRDCVPARRMPSAYRLVTPRRLRAFRCLVVGSLVVVLGLPGCCLTENRWSKNRVPCQPESLTPILSGPQQLTPEDACINDCGEDVREMMSPNEITDYANLSYMDMTLEDCVAAALQNSKVMRDLGVSILRAPGTSVSAYDPAIAYTDPRQGEEAALSAFDATLFSSAMLEKNDRASNNRFLGNLGLLDQELYTYRLGVQKTAATGTNFRLSNTTVRDFNNQLGNFFPSPSSSWDTYLDLEFRQPLLQGGGVTFNRIAGPNSTPGAFNGVLLARAQTDMSLARFEQAVQELLSNVENAYWDLYFAYRDLSAKIDARDEALSTWQKIASQAAGAEGARSGAETQQIAQAEEQYFRFDAEVIDALNGRIIDGTRTNNGSTGGTFRGNGGVRIAERRLRLLCGMPINAAQLIRPSDTPTDALVSFDWAESVDTAIAKRPELRQQQWNIKRYELEHVAAKNFLLPRLDVLGRYRFRGFGQDLLGNDLDFSESPVGSSAVEDLLSGKRQEFQVGAELSIPIGYRQEFAAVRNSELRLSRERALLREQQRDVMLGLSNSIGELNRSFDAKMAAMNRLKSAERLRDALEAVVDVKNAAPLDVKLEAQRRVADAKIQYYRTQVEYMLAIKNVHHERSSLLEYFNVQLAESASASKAYDDAQLRDSLRNRPMNYVSRDLVIAQDKESDETVHHYSTPNIVPAPVSQPAAEGPDSPDLGAAIPYDSATPVSITPSPAGIPASNMPLPVQPTLPPIVGGTQQ
jgi:outer membrane protein TolC